MVKTLILKWTTGILAAFGAFVLPIKPYLLVVGLAVALDMFIAVYAKVKIKGWQAFQSKRMKDTVAKSGIYFGAVLLGHGIDLAFEISFILRTISLYILLTELKSIDEKYFELYGKSLFKWLIESLPNMNKQKDTNA